MCTKNSRLTWSDRISNSLHVASSDPVPKANPLGKYYNKKLKSLYRMKVVSKF